MRILLDESLPRVLGLALIGHDVSTVQQESWTSLSNGALLRQASATFDVLLTADRNIEFQQNLATLPMAVVVLMLQRERKRRRDGERSWCPPHAGRSVTAALLR